MIRIAVCDDDYSICEQIQQYIRQLIGDSQKISIQLYSSSMDFVEELDEGNSVNYDIVFLDYEMDGVSGKDVGKKIREVGHEECLIIYVSNHSEEIFNLLEIGVHQFIHKPIKLDVFETIFFEAMKKAESNTRKLRIKINGEEIFLLKKDIIYIELQWRCIKIHTNAEDYITYEKLDSVEERLDSPYKNFIRIHKSFLINADYIKGIKNKTITLDNGKELEISKGYMKNFKINYFQYLQVKKC